MAPFNETDDYRIGTIHVDTDTSIGRSVPVLNAHMGHLHTLPAIIPLPQTLLNAPSAPK